MLSKRKTVTNFRCGILKPIHSVRGENRNESLTHHQLMIDTSTWYKNQSWLVRRWRDRYLLKVPISAVRIYIHEQRRPMRDEHDWRLTFEQSWSLARGLCDCSRKHLHLWGESFAKYADDE